MSGASLRSGQDLDTAIYISLFTDRVAETGDKIPDNTSNRRGWWGDNQPSGNTVPIGSRLWLLNRSASPSQQILNQAVGYAKEALQWMVSDGVAANIDVVGNWNANNFLALQVTIYRSDGNVIFNKTYDWAWSQQISGT